MSILCSVINTGRCSRIIQESVLVEIGLCTTKARINIQFSLLGLLMVSSFTKNNEIMTNALGQFCLFALFSLFTALSKPYLSLNLNFCTLSFCLKTIFGGAMRLIC